MPNQTWKAILVREIKEAALSVAKEHAEYIQRVELTVDGARVITAHDTWIIEVKN